MAISADLYDTLFADVPFQVRRSRHLDEALGDWTNTDIVSVTIPDHTRPLEASVALNALRTRLQNIQHVVVGLGLHRPMTEAELRETVGVIPEVLVQHNPDDCVEIDRVGDTSIGISRYLVESEWSLTVGTIEVHQYAGVSGGYKGVVVGCGSRASIGRLHGRHFVCDPDVQVGRISPNPFRSEIERIGHLTNCRLALAFVPSLNEWWFGHPSALMRLAEIVIQPWIPVHRQYKHVLLHVPASKVGSFYQASRAATYLALSASPPLVEGGRIILSASMSEGIGSEEGFRRALEQNRPPWTDTLNQDVSGAGAQRIWMLARLAQRYHLAVYNVADAGLFEQLDIEVIDHLPTEDVLEVHHPFKEIPQLV